MRDLIASIKTISAITNPELVPAAAPTWAEGLVFYDNVHKALSYYNDDSDVTINVGQEMVLRCINDTGGPVIDGDAVYISGAAGVIPEITKAISTISTPDIIGVVTSAAASTETCYVTIFGLVHGVDTSTYSPGDILYLSSSVAGGLTNIAPILPLETIIVGTVVDSAVMICTFN